METIVAIIIAVIGSNALWAFITFLIDRSDEKQSVKGKLNILEKDTLRTQLLLLILLRPQEKHEIITIAEHYFADLHGNWYMTSIFNKWLEDTNTAEPEWFERKE